jgi:hypothetical protein
MCDGNYPGSYLRITKYLSYSSVQQILKTIVLARFDEASYLHLDQILTRTIIFGNISSIILTRISN